MTEPNNNQAMNYNLNINSVEPIPGFEARAAFCVDSSSVFREENEISPMQLDDHHSIIPWGATTRCRTTS